MSPVPTTASSSDHGDAQLPLHALPAGTRLVEFEIERVIGRGGFSIVYLAFDHSLHRRVALKEYLPDTLAHRTNGLTIVPHSAHQRETFDVGLRSFLEEARLLAQFDHPALVKVYRFWEANGTAYMAMAYYEGPTLREAYGEGARLAPDVLHALVVPLLDAVELLHGAKCLHRDIAPDNVIVQRDGRPVLLDFGAARRIIGERTQALTVILKTGYAPIEQYSDDGGLAQGPWTDVYAFGAMLYAAINGKGPPPAVSRAFNDSYVPLTKLAPAGYEPGFLHGIDVALAFRPEDRPQSIAEFRSALGIAPTYQPLRTEADEVTVRAVGLPTRPPPYSDRATTRPVPDDRTAPPPRPDVTSPAHSVGPARTTTEGNDSMPVVPRAEPPPPPPSEQTVAVPRSERPPPMRDPGRALPPTAPVPDSSVALPIPESAPTMRTEVPPPPGEQTVAVPRSERPPPTRDAGRTLESPAPANDRTVALPIPESAPMVRTDAPPLSEHTVAVPRSERPPPTRDAGHAPGPPAPAHDSTVARRPPDRAPPPARAEAPPPTERPIPAQRPDQAPALTLGQKRTVGIIVAAVIVVAVASTYVAYRATAPEPPIVTARTGDAPSPALPPQGAPPARPPAASASDSERAGTARPAASEPPAKPPATALPPPPSSSRPPDPVAAPTTMRGDVKERDRPARGSVQDAVTAKDTREAPRPVPAPPALVTKAEPAKVDPGAPERAKAATPPPPLTAARPEPQKATPPSPEPAKAAAPPTATIVAKAEPSKAPSAADVTKAIPPPVAPPSPSTKPEPPLASPAPEPTKAEPPAARTPAKPATSPWERGRELELAAGSAATDLNAAANLAEAAKLYQLAADQGDPRAQNSLGWAYQNGRGVPVDYVAARRWYEKGAAQGNAAAQNNLGNLHNTGLGVPRNDVLAVEWYRKSADQGYAIAQNNLGLMLENGRGVFRNVASAAALYRQAAEAGNINAMYNLARMYEAGNGVPKDRAEAIKWFRAAADKGQKSAVTRLAELEGTGKR